MESEAATRSIASRNPTVSQLLGMPQSDIQEFKRETITCVPAHNLTVPITMTHHEEHAV
jgi:hypothetical protein